ncbi:MAG: carboxypeptidase-like regulatory domain-containing protein [Bacteroidaceae bacterium]|nr:carboxypeptidase-like regulatory domain-containing protein [Bacteroidaceae bacterium]
MLLLFLFPMLSAQAQAILTGTVTDAQTGEPLSYANVYYEDGKVTQTDEEGRFKRNWRRGKLTASIVGYMAQTVTVKNQTKVDFKLSPLNTTMGEATVTAKKKKYSRKDNPAVILMRRVIAAKEMHDLSERDYYSLHKYSKMQLAIDDVDPQKFNEGGSLQMLSFMQNTIQVCNETGRYILPLTIDETASQQVWRKSTRTKKNIVTGQRSSGLNEIISTGENLNIIMKDLFTDVNLYDNELNMLHHRFRSPLGGEGAIQFYRYFLGDTLVVDGERCIEVSFTPNNQQDFGLSGYIFITVDSTYRLVYADITLPHNSDVNFVKDMRLIQHYAPLETGEQVLRSDDMLLHLEIVSFITAAQIRRTTEYSRYDFSAVPDHAFNFEGPQRTDPNARMRDEEFWDRYTANHMGKEQKRMGTAMSEMRKKSIFKYALPVFQAVVENFVETGRKSKVDIGPINTLVSFNKVEGTRFRASAQTTAYLNPHFFLKGHIAYGLRDHRWKGGAELVYSLNKKVYRPHEFPMRNITLSYRNEVTSPSDKFLGPDKDNVFKSVRWNNNNLMYYQRSAKLNYTHEWGSGLQLWGELEHERMEPTLDMFYQKISPTGVSSNKADHIAALHKSNISVGLRFQPGSTFVNTKQHRFETNYDAPQIVLSHTVGLKNVLQSEYASNITNVGIFKRFWVGSWGKIDTYLEGSVQWNTVPYPFLIAPSANQSYFIESGAFSMIRTMEFLSDRQVQAFFAWDMSGKLFNRIPLIRRLKWREHLGVNALWGHLTEKNNPFIHNQSDMLFYFPGQWQADGTFHTYSHIIDYSKPYVEVFFGVHNVFKVLQIDVFRRLNYLEIPETKKWGVRLKLHIGF